MSGITEAALHRKVQVTLANTKAARVSITQIRLQWEDIENTMTGRHILLLVNAANYVFKIIEDVARELKGGN